MSPYRLALLISPPQLVLVLGGMWTGNDWVQLARRLGLPLLMSGGSNRGAEWMLGEEAIPTASPWITGVTPSATSRGGG